MKTFFCETKKFCNFNFWAKFKKYFKRFVDNIKKSRGCELRKKKKRNLLKNSFIKLRNTLIGDSIWNGNVLEKTHKTKKSSYSKV